jgi:LuxR family quorum sensing-dependent transcriptional regulator
MFSGDYGRQALDAIERLEHCATLSDAVEVMAVAVARFGFETILVTGLPEPGQRFSQRVIARRWSAEWFAHYTEENLDRVDPVARHCRRSAAPFEWVEAPYDPDTEREAAAVMRRAIDFRMARGFTVPIHGPAGYRAGVSLGGVDLDLNRHSKPALHLLTIYGFDQIHRLRQPYKTPHRSLTPREREVLNWAAHGKSAWEVGEILHIAQRTAEEHMATASRKLGAMNKTHAVAIAIRRKLIEP